MGGQAFSSACLWGRAWLGLACFLLACVRGQHLPANGPLLERFLPPREGLLDLRVHGLHGWVSAFSRWDAAPRARAGSMPGGRDSGPLLPLMKLPRIAYRKSIKPSQIIPPSRQPVHQPGATISPLGGDSCRSFSLGWAGLCSLLCCLCMLWPALPCPALRWLLRRRLPGSHQRHLRKSSVASTASSRTRAQCSPSQRN